MTITPELHQNLLQGFGEACQATVAEALQSEARARAETARVRQAAANVEREQAANRLVSAEGIREARFQKEPASSATPACTTVALTPVMDMQFCIGNLNAISQKGSRRLQPE
jgi:hypothetical protein